MSFMRSLLIVTVLLLSACVSEPLPDGFKGSDDFDQIAAAKNRISLGLTYLQNGNYSQAKFNLDKALQFAPRLADAHYSIAFYYQQVGEIERADESYQRALDFEPRNADIANSYGAFLCQNGQYDNAKKYFLKAVNSNNYISSAETYENLALCSQSQGQIDDALTYVQNALNHQPSRAKSLLLLVELQMQKQQWQQAKDNLRRYEKLARVTPETLWLAITLERELNNIELAKGYGDMLIRMYPSHPRTIEYVKSRDQFTKVDESGKILRQLKPSASIATASSLTPEKQTPTPEPIPTSQVVSEKAPAQSVTEPELPAQSAVETARTEQPVTESDSPAGVRQGIQSAQAEVEQKVAEAKDVVDSAASNDRKIDDPVEQSVEKVADQRQAEQSLQRNENELSEAATSAEAVAQASSVPQYHTVLKGENLYRISLKYNVKMKSLMEWNDLQEGQAIFVGMELLVTEPKSVEQ